jgi:hypothetical protein
MVQSGVHGRNIDDYTALYVVQRKETRTLLDTVPSGPLPSIMDPKKPYNWANPETRTSTTLSVGLDFISAVRST